MLWDINTAKLILLLLFCWINNFLFSLHHSHCDGGKNHHRHSCYLIRGFENVFSGKHKKCVSQTHKTWFYYDYTTNTNNSKTEKGTLSFDEAISTEKIRKRCFHCWQLHVISTYTRCVSNVLGAVKYDSNYKCE